MKSKTFSVIYKYIYVIMILLCTEYSIIYYKIVYIVVYIVDIKYAIVYIVDYIYHI